MKETQSAIKAPFDSTMCVRLPTQWGVRTCVIFNPAARGGKARHFRHHLNAIGAARNGFESARLGVLPLGTVNVFARELAIPTKLDAAWAAIHQGRETRIDLPRAEYSVNGKPQHRYFA